MLTRPPPLQLQIDNTRPGISLALHPQPQAQPLTPKSQPRFYAQIGSFAAQVYQANWRNFVVAVAAVNALRFFISALTAFHDVDIDLHQHHVPKLAQISLALGVLYLITAVIQIYGALSASLQRPTLIRVYVYLAFLSALLITSAGFVSAIEYFLLADDIVGECVSLAVSGSWISKTIFRGKVSQGSVPSAKVAQEQCLAAWSRGSLSQVLAVVIFSLVPAIVFFFLAYTYYRQTIDPTHSACLVSSRDDVVRMEAFAGGRYSPIYNGNGNAPPSRSHGAAEVRTRTPRRPQLQQGQGIQLDTSSHTPSPYGLTPGPPSYAPLRPAAYGYGPGAAWFAAGSRIEGRTM